MFFSSLSLRRILYFAPLYLLTFSLALGLFLPIYTDEIGWRFQERAGFDGVDTMLSDLCGPQTIISPPSFMLPVRYVSAVIASAFPDPLFIRLSGVIGAFLWLILFLTFLSRQIADHETQALLRNININYLTIGLFPFLFVMSRPELPLNLSMMLALLLLFSPKNSVGKDDDSTGMRVRSVFRTFACITLYAFHLSYHPKSVLLVPFFIVIANLIGRNLSLPLRIMMNILMPLMFYQAYQYWSVRFSCADDAILASDLATQNLMAMLPLAPSLQEIFQAYLSSHSFVQYFTNLGIASPEFTMSTWILSNDVPALASTFSKLMIAIIWILWIYAASVFFVTRFFKFRRKPWQIILILMTIIFPIAFMSITQFVKNAYEITLIGPMFLIGVSLLYSAYPPTKKEKRYLEKWNLILTVLAVLSVAANIYFYSSGLASAASRSGYIPEQIRSQPVFNYNAARLQIDGAARQCRLENNSSTRRLLVDDVTYLSFQNTSRPFHYLGVLSVWNGSISDPLAYLKSRNSSGLIVGCHLLSESLRALTVRSGQFCCMNLEK